MFSKAKSTVLSVMMQKQILGVITALATVLASMVAAKADDGEPRPVNHYQFVLRKGRGRPVCEAYLRRLNVSDYQEPPYCGRPENTEVLGFSALNRVPLSPEAAHTLLPRVRDFTSLGTQGSREHDEAWDAKRKSMGLGPDTDSLTDVEKLIAKDEIEAWSYQPNVDIDNDGVPDNVVIWQGYGIVDGGARRCGDAILSGNMVWDRQPAYAFVVAPENTRLIEDKTRAIFGHPSGGYRLSNGKTGTRFHPIGTSIGIFEYQGLYYFDTFFDAWGDFRGHRQHDPDINHILGVFLRQNGHTRQVCELQMLIPNPESSIEN